MAKKIPKGQLNKKNKHTLKALTNLMKDLNEKYSIRVGILGKKAYQKHPHTKLTYSELGAIHEYGATIQVTEKMRNYLRSIGIYLKSETTTIVIPTRSFLRMPLLSGEFKEHLLTGTGLKENKDFAGAKGNTAREYNLDLAKIKQESDPDIMKTLANWIAAEAELRVMDAFITGGFGNWAAISEVTKKNRTGDPNHPPLDNTGDLRESISSQVKRVK